jgi:hypothetical protein
VTILIIDRLKEIVANNCKERQKATTLVWEMIRLRWRKLDDKADFLLFKGHDGWENFFDKSIISAVNF